MWKREFVSTQNGDFELFINGSGPPLCVTHLYSECNERGNYFADCFTPYFTVYLINLRNAGESVQANAKSELSLSQSASDLEAIRKALEFPNWSFAGHSTGGMLGLVYAIEQPDGVDKLVITGAAGSYEYMQHPGSIYCKENAHNERVLELLKVLKDPNATIEERRAANREWMGFSLFRPERYDDYFSKPSSGKVVPSRLDYFSYDDLPKYDLFPALPDVQHSIIVASGEHDAQCPLDCSIHIEEALPHATLKVFSESNHLPFLEEPEAFERMVSEFLALTC